MNKKVFNLRKGQSLAPVNKTYDAGRVTLGITRYETPTETGFWHTHENPFVSLVLHGGNLEYREGKKIERTNGSINFYHAHEPHRNIYKVFPSTHISLEVIPSFLSQYGYNEHDLDSTFRHHQAPHPLIRLLSEASYGDASVSTSVEMLLLELMGDTEKLKGTKPEEWTLKMKDILHDRWKENISLDELSKLVNVHPTTISKHFRKYFGSTYGEYCRKLKVDKTISMIKSHNHSLAEIAFHCGFSDQSHFIRVFKSVTGFLPRAFMKI